MTRPITSLPRGALLALAAGVLQACTTPAPVDEAAMQPATAEVVTRTEPVPELTLNLPEDRSCQCEPETSRDQTFLERGYTALARGDHIEAVQHFQRYQRLESSPEADWESGMAIAYMSMLPNSPFFDPDAAASALASLNKQLKPAMTVHENSLMMRESLEALLVMDRHIADLEANNATLKQDLEKREEALKRLRELTLGQRGARQ